MRNKNVWVIVAALAVVALIFILALILPRRTASLPESLAPLLSPSPEGQSSAVPAGETAGAESTVPSATPVPAKGYVYVAAGSSGRWFALPEEDLSFTISQTNGEEKLENVIHLTRDGVYMESSTCENQDCVRQGPVTLDNKDTRVLANMIICLPHQVSIELYTPEEWLAQAGQ